MSARALTSLFRARPAISHATWLGSGSCLPARRLHVDLPRRLQEDVAEEKPASSNVENEEVSRPRPNKQRHRTRPDKKHSAVFINPEEAKALGQPVEARNLESINVLKYAVPSGGFIKLIELNEPKTRNALSRKMIEELAAEAEAIHNAPVSDDVRAVVITSTSPEAFCAGANLKERAAMSPDEVKQLLALLRATFDSISRLPIPSISAIGGYALGGGLELALCTTSRCSTTSATFALPEASLGIVPGAGGTHRLPALVGRSFALEMMLTGKHVFGPLAQKVHLVRAAVKREETPAEELEQVRSYGLVWAAKVAEKAPLAIRAILRAQQDPRQNQEAENEAYESILDTEDRTEALQAFREKRKPVFKGR